MPRRKLEAQLSTSICNVTGLTVTTSPEWIVVSEECCISISVIGAAATRLPFSVTDPTHFCKAIGQPITRKPEWTDIQLSDNCSVTFAVYGDNILFSHPKGKTTTESLLKFFAKRMKVIEEAFGPDKPYCEVKNYSTIGMPSKKIRNIFSRQLQEKNLIGFFYFNASKGIQTSC